MSLLDLAITRVAQGTVKFLKMGGMTVGSVSELNGLDADPNTESYQSAYSKHVWAYAGIYAIASSAAGVPLKVMRKIKRGGKWDMEEVAGHRFAELMANPNEHMTGYDLVELLFIFLESGGEGYFLLDDLTGEPLAQGAKLTLEQVKEVWPIFPQHMKPLPDKKEFLRGYRMSSNELGKSKDFAAAEIIHIKYANPRTLYHGQGSLEPAGGSITGDLYAEKYDNRFFKNGAIPPAFLKTEKTLTKEQREELKASWSKAYAGVANAHKIALLEAGLDFSSSGQSRKDMEFLEGRRVNMGRVLGSLGVPLIMVGNLDAASYNNAKEQKRIFWENTMIPKLKKVGAFLTKRLHAMGEKEDLVVVFDTSGVEALQEDAKMRADTAKVWVDAGVPLNEAIRIFGPKGMEPVEGGDVGMVNAGLVPLEEAALGSEADPAAGEDELTPEDAPAPMKPGKPKPGEDPVEEPDPEDPAEKGMGAVERANKAQDDALWRSFVSRQKGDAARLRAVVKRIFRAQRAKVLEKISAHYPTVRALPDAATRAPQIQVFLLNSQEETKALGNAAKPLLKKTYAAFGKNALAEVGASFDFNLESIGAVKFMDTRVFRFAEKVTETTQERLRKLIEANLRDGVSQPDMVDAIKAEFRFAEAYRAARIARTETQIAANAGNFEGYAQAGVDQIKWLSSRDVKVRPSHKEMDGEIVDAGDPFIVGDGAMLLYPCDPYGPPEEVINCRCTARAIINRRTA